MPQQKCAFCEELTTRTCQICGRPMCSEHTAADQDDFCIECCNDVTTEVKKEPLVDSEGEIHNGALLHPVGEFYTTTPGIISKMSDEELERFYTKYSLLVKQQEEAASRSRIVTSMIYMEKEERARTKQRRTAAVRLPGMDRFKKEDSQINLLASVIKKSGITKEMLQKLIEKKKGENTYESA